MTRTVQRQGFYRDGVCLDLSPYDIEMPPPPVLAAPSRSTATAGRSRGQGAPALGHENSRSISCYRRLDDQIYHGMVTLPEVQIRATHMLFWPDAGGTVQLIRPRGQQGHADEPCLLSTSG